LSSEAVDVITKLRNMKDEEDDWSRWKDVIFRAKAALVPTHVKAEVQMRPLEPKFKNVRKKGLQQRLVQKSDSLVSSLESNVREETLMRDNVSTSTSNPPTPSAEKAEDVVIKKGALEGKTDSGNFCPECYLPLFPDPSPDKLYIYLHALRYTTSLGTFETPIPLWAKEDYIVPQQSIKPL